MDPAQDPGHLSRSVDPLLSLETDPVTGRVAIRGEMDHASAGRLRDEVVALLATGSPDVVLDCSALDFMDSGGVAVVAELYQQARDAGGGLSMEHCSPTVAQLMAVCGLDRYVTVNPA